MGIRGYIYNFLEKHYLTKGLIYTARGRVQPIFLDYPVSPTPRYGYGKPAHRKIYEAMNRKRGDYRKILLEFQSYSKSLERIRLTEADGSMDPRWNNYMFSGLDAVSLYCSFA